MKDKVILTDVDGVLLDWSYSFGQWMSRYGYEADESHATDYAMKERYNITALETKRLVRMFNESATIRKLPPLRDSVKYVRKLHEEFGYVFHVITSMTNDQYAQHLRTKNLIELYGPSVFERFVYLDTGADKDDALEEYRGTECWWVEDKPANADVGARAGLRSLLMEHDHNKSYVGEAQFVRNWKDVYTTVNR